MHRFCAGMRFPKPASPKSAERQARQEVRKQYLAQLSSAEPSPETSKMTPPNACCSKAYVVWCYCGGAKECPEHPGLVCFGKYSHD